MIWRLLAVLFAALFGFAAAVQHNDPDPLLWIVLYLWPAALCVLFALPLLRSASLQHPLYLASLTTAILYALLALLTFPGWLPDWFADEEIREAGGLMIAATACAMLAWRLRKLASGGSA